MKAGRVSGSILYVMGVAPGGVTGISIIGVHELSIYRGKPGSILYFETFSVEGSPTAQTFEIIDASLEFHPRVLVCESFRSRQPITSDKYLSPVKVAQRLEFCTETNYVICPFFWQTADEALSTASDEDLALWGLKTDKPGQERDATRHAITFIRRAKADPALRDSAWGSDDVRFGSRRGNTSRNGSRPVKRGSARSVRRLDLTDGTEI